MIPSQVEKEVLIEAPIDVVWRTITEPEQIRQWFAEEVALDGKEGRFKFEHGRTFYLRVEAFEPPHRFAYRWGDDRATCDRPENSMLVEFTLSAEHGGTRLRVVESGFDQVDWTDEHKQKYFDDHSAGWQMYLGRVRDRVRP